MSRGGGRFKRLEMLSHVGLLCLFLVCFSPLAGCTNSNNKSNALQHLYETLINTDAVDQNAVLYGVPTSIATLGVDRMFLLNLSFVDTNVTHATLYFYLRRVPMQGVARPVRLAVHTIGRRGEPQRAVQYISLANVTQSGWVAIDFTDVINRLLKPAKRSKQLSVALQFEQQRNGKMHQVSPHRFVVRRNGPYVVFSTASSDSTMNFYQWFETVLKNEQTLMVANGNGNGNASDPKQLWNATGNSSTAESLLGNTETPTVAIDNGHRFDVFNSSQDAGAESVSFSQAFDELLMNDRPASNNERVCSVRPWKLAIPNFLRKFVIHPKNFEINRCSGWCVPGLSPEDFRNSLIGRTYYDRLGSGSRLMQKCCVPDKLGSLEMVFLSTKDSQHVMSRVAIPNLVAQSCKCVYSYP